MAAGRLSLVQVARYTTPMPPTPSSPSIRYWPICVPAQSAGTPASAAPTVGRNALDEQQLHDVLQLRIPASAGGDEPGTVRYALAQRGLVQISDLLVTVDRHTDLLCYRGQICARNRGNCSRLRLHPQAITILRLPENERLSSCADRPLSRRYYHGICPASASRVGVTPAGRGRGVWGGPVDRKSVQSDASARALLRSGDRFRSPACRRRARPCSRRTGRGARCPIRFTSTSSSGSCTMTARPRLRPLRMSGGAAPTAVCSASSRTVVDGAIQPSSRSRDCDRAQALRRPLSASRDPVV